MLETVNILLDELVANLANSNPNPNPNPNPNQKQSTFLHFT